MKRDILISIKLEKRASARWRSIRTHGKQTRAPTAARQKPLAHFRNPAYGFIMK